MNVFLNGADRDIETAIMLENAHVYDIGNAVAFTDGDRVFINTEDRLYDILPAYDHKMLKWLLWHERMHLELRHHDRFFKYLHELEEAEALDKFHITKEEINIIMDILVHDSLAKMFPDLIETAVNNLAQMRNRNSLGYTFKTSTLEEMLDEYSKYKHPEEESEDGDSDGEDEESKDGSDDKKDGDDKSEHKDDKKDGDGEDKEKSHSEGGTTAPDKDEDKPEDHPEKIEDAEEPAPEPEHDKTDWSKLEEIDSKEFITKDTGDKYIDKINELKRKKFKLAKITETLNGLVTSVRQRTYAKPSPVKVGGGVVLKGSTPGRTQLYLCFDASGSMGWEMDTFKDIISKSIPQAMKTPVEWFSGFAESDIERRCHNPKGRTSRYFKGTFQDFMEVQASAGYDDDGDRTIEMCYLAEQAGYTPIGITDGGGRLSWSKDMAKKLRRTVLVGDTQQWLDLVKKVNPRIETICI